MRRVQQGSTWHPAADDLEGTAAYGNYGNSTSDATFSIVFSKLITSDNTEFLFASGTCLFLPSVNSWLFHGIYR